MRLFRGFKGKYFSLAAILACSAGASLEASNVSLETKDYEARQTLASEKEGETEEDVALNAIRVVSVIGAKKSYEQSSSRTLKQTSHTIDSTQIITSEEIALKGFKSVSEAVSSVSGVSFATNGGAGQSASIYLRGMNAANTLMLIDGVRVNDVSGLSGAQSEIVELYDADRIEIIKGAQSGVWGIDASGGVINIITKPNADGFKADMLSEIGSNDWKKYALKTSYANNFFDLSLALSLLDTDGISAAAAKKGEAGYGNRNNGFEKDGFQNRMVSVKGGVNLTDKDRLEFFIRSNKAKNHFDGGAGVDAKDYDDLYGFGVDKYFNVIRTSIYSLGYAGSYEKHKINLRANYSDFRRSFYGGYAGDTREIYASDEFSYLEDSFVLAGFGYLKDRVKLSAGASFANDSMDDKYVFFTNSNKFDRLVLSQSVRFDARDTFEDKLAFKLGVKYYFYEDFFISALYKTGFLAPNLYQQNYGGTKDLKAEESKGYEVSFGNRNFLITYFDQKVQNSIEYGGSWPSDFYYNINGKSRFKGVEVGVNYQFHDLLGELSYTYLDAKDANDVKIARRARDKIDGSITWFAPYDISVNVKGSYIGSRFDASFAGAPQTGKYFLTDASINCHLKEQIDLYLKIANIFDRYYQEVDGYETYGRSFYVGVRGGF